MYIQNWTQPPQGVPDHVDYSFKSFISISLLINKKGIQQLPPINQCGSQVRHKGHYPKKKQRHNLFQGDTKILTEYLFNAGSDLLSNNSQNENMGRLSHEEHFFLLHWVFNGGSRRESYWVYRRQLLEGIWINQCQLFNVSCALIFVRLFYTWKCLIQILVSINQLGQQAPSNLTPAPNEIDNQTFAMIGPTWATN